MVEFPWSTVCPDPNMYVTEPQKGTSEGHLVGYHFGMTPWSSSVLGRSQQQAAF